MKPDDIEFLKSKINSYPDFPKPGIIFRDIFAVFGDAEALAKLVETILCHFKEINCEFDAVVGLEARGFIIGPILSYKLGKSFIPIRKVGKLPGCVKQESFSLEYAEATFEIQKGCLKPGSKVIVVDDLLATGGTMAAACKLLHSMEVEIVHCFSIIELLSLKGRDALPKSVPYGSLIQY